VKTSNRATIIALSIAGALTAPFLITGGAVALSANGHKSVDLSQYDFRTFDHYILPACNEDAPDPSMTVPCVWEDEGVYWVMNGKGGSDSFEPCATEDSDECVWDSAERGNRSKSPDAIDRFLVSASQTAHAPLYPDAVESK
jgi:hypothetical protein